MTYSITAGSLAYSDAFTGALTRDAGEGVGTYPIRQGTLALTANYELTFVEGIFTISPLPVVTVTVDPGQSKVYGNADPVFTYSSNPSGVTFTGALSRAAGENVGTYAITQGTLAATGYTINFVSDYFEITPKSITVTADPKTKVYGDADPALTYQASPALLNGDSFSGSLTRAAGENVGAHQITQGTLTAGDNYAITFIPADLTITKRSIEVTADNQSKQVGEPDPALTYSITAGSLAFSDAFTGALTRNTGEAVGTYAIKQGTLALSSNYELTFVEGAFTILQRLIYMPIIIK